MTRTQVTSGRLPAPAGPFPQAGRKSQVLLFVLLALCLAISGLPSPLYGAYQREWRFSSLTLTVIFAAYALAALAALLVVGRLSDSIGRKPVLLTSQVMLLAGLGLFVAARSAGWLIVARALHGAAIGSIAATAGAALLDLRPAHGAVIGRLTGIVLTFGMTTGVLGSALLAQFAPHPLVTPYIVAAAAVLATLSCTALMPESLRARTALNLRIRPRIPAQIHGPFWFAAVSTAATWSVLGLYLSLAPGLADQAVGSHNLLVGGTIAAALIGTGAVAQLVTQRADALRLAIGGDLVLGIALLLSVTAVAAHSAWAIYLTAVAMGAGLGPAFNSSLRHLAAVIPAAERGQVMSAYYLAGYLSLAIPSMLAGLAATRFGLTLTYVAFGAFAAITCGAAGWLGSRLAPERHRPNAKVGPVVDDTPRR
ncbi:MAG TPA: MFS transporter [Streptosporangiaceae bacterium]